MKVYVVDPKTGKVLVNAGGDTPHDPASLTKMMTFYVTLEAIRDKKLKLDEVLVVSPAAAKLEGSHISAGSRLTVSELLGAMMTKSDNGAAATLAARMGDDMVDRMNATAKRLGLTQTHFSNPHGLPKGNGEAKSTTPRDMALLIQRIHKDFAKEAAQYMTKPSVEYDGEEHQATHFLKNKKFADRLSDGYEAAAKTGFTKAAGHNITAMITAPDGRQLVTVVMGSKRRWSHKEVEAMGAMSAEALSEHRGDIKGNRVRDALVQHLALNFIGGKSRGVAINVPTQPPAEAASLPVAVVPVMKPEKEPAHPAIRTLPPSAQKAVAECKKTLETRTRPGPESDVKVTVPPVATTLAAEERELAELQKRLGNKKLKPKERKHLQHAIAELSETIGVERKFLGQVNAIENQANEAIYTKTNYDAQIVRAKTYMDAFVDGWEGALPPGGKSALKQKFHAIADGTAGKETGWNPEIVKGSANRARYTGVFQTGWEFITDARKEMERCPAMKAVLDKNPEDAKILELSKDLSAAKGLPTTSFAGQGAAFAGMAVASFKQFVSSGGKPEHFNGATLYDEHMMGGKGARNFREQLADNPNKKGAPGVGKATYNGNYLITKNPYAQMNDLNPNRIVYADATAKDVQQMMHDKSVHAYNRMVKKMEKGELSRERVAAFEQAFLPEWTNNSALKAQDIARVSAQKDIGLQLRADAEAKIAALAQSKHGVSPAVRDQILCEILKPMLLPTQPLPKQRG